jgi:protein-tyrosine phosphatase
MNDDEILDKKRLLPMETVYNVRELGGYRAGDRVVSWGLLYRAGDINSLTKHDKALLEARNIKTIVDFRDDKERRNAPDDTLSTVQNRYELTVDTGTIDDLTSAEAGMDGPGLMEILYQSLVSTTLEPYREFFKVLGRAENTPLLFHCSAGKDRTGVGAALLLSALGVDRETIYRDYLLSGEYLKGKYDAWLKQAPHWAPFMTVDRRYIAAAFNAIDTRFGGVESYLQDVLGADIKGLREIYTEPA